MNCYLGTKKGRCKDWSSICLSQELLQERPKFRFDNFCYKFFLGIIFERLCLKNAFDQEKATKT